MERTEDGKLLNRNSERSSYRACRQKWKWGWVDGLKPKDLAPALRFGSLVHLALAGFYIPGVKRGPHPAELFVQFYEEDLAESYKWGQRDEDETWHDARDLGIAMLEHYVETFGQDEGIEVISPEMPFAVDLRNPKNGKYSVTPVGTFDAAIRNLNNGKIGLLEHKTAKSIMTKHLQLDEQAGTYHALAGEYLAELGYLEKGEEIDFILYNFLRKAVKDERPQNERGLYLNKPKKDDLLAKCKDLGLDIPSRPKVEDLEFALEMEGIDPGSLGEVSKQQPPPYFVRMPVYRDEADRETVKQRIVEVSWEMKQAQDGKLPIYKNPTRDCSFCAFYDMCELHETGGDWEEMRDLTMTTWDPYADHVDDRSIPSGV